MARNVSDGGNVTVGGACELTRKYLVFATWGFQK
jgi:hypothetical protein